MNFPDYIILSNRTVPTMVVFLIIFLFFSNFIVWKEGKKDGFAEDRGFDLWFLCIGLSLLGSFLFAKTKFLNSLDINIGGFSLLGLLVSYMALIFMLTKKWKWSVYRSLDIHGMAFNMLFGLLFFVAFLIFKNPVDLIPAGIFVTNYIVAQKLKAKGVKSGYIFIIFCVITSILGFFFVEEFSNLLFVISFNTIGLGIYLTRIKKSMNKKVTAPDFLNSVKNILKAKEKKLKADQKLLISEDPYMVVGRTEDNSSMFDDAILEDSRKESVDLQTNVLASAQLGVKRALARLKIGKYGICEVCGKPIESARLKALPTATTCTEHMN